MTEEGFCWEKRSRQHHMLLEDLARLEQSVSKSVNSDSNSYGGGRVARPSEFSRSELKESAEKRNHSRLAYDHASSQLKAKNIGKLRQPVNRSIDRSKKREGGAHTAQQWSKHSTHTKAMRPTVDMHCEQLMQATGQKEKILKDLDKRIEVKMSEWLLFEAEVNRKMSSYSSELNHVQEQLKSEKQELAALRTRISESQEAYNARSNDLNRRKLEVEELCRYVEQTTRDQDFLKCQLEAEKSQCRARLLQCETTKKELEARERELKEAEARIRLYEDELLESMSELEKRQQDLSKRNTELIVAVEQNSLKQQQLDQRERVISMYVNQLNSCISNLTNERSQLLNLGTSLERRCNQLENLELKLYRKINDDSTNELDRYLTDSTNLDLRTPIKRSCKENAVSAFTEKRSRKKEQRQHTIEQRSSDLLEDSPLSYDRLC